MLATTRTGGFRTRRGAMALAAPIFLALPGCLGAIEGPADALADGDAVAQLPALDYVCPPGETERRDDGLCIARLASLTESMQEPFLAIDPNRPHVMAIGVNGGHTTRAVDPLRERPGFDWFAVDVYVTEDAGATWTLRQIPFVDAPQPGAPLDTGGSFDPALAFDDDGMLHVSGIVSWGRTPPLERGYETFYTSSADLGRTWSEPVTFTSDGDNDRNWLTVGPDGAVYISWQNLYKSSDVVWSLDAGATWSEPLVLPSCIAVSPIVVHEGVPLVACSVYEGGRGEPNDCYQFQVDKLRGIDLYAIHVANGTAERIGSIGSPTAVWPQLRTLADGALVALFEECGGARLGVLLARSDDGGRTWSAPVDALASTTHDDAWRTPRMIGFETDPWGGAHVLVAQPNDDWTDTVEALHLAFDARLERASQRLFKPTGGAAAGVPRSLGWAAGDHVYGLAFTDDRGFLVWTESRTLAYTAFEPRAAG